MKTSPALVLAAVLVAGCAPATALIMTGQAIQDIDNAKRVQQRYERRQEARELVKEYSSYSVYVRRPSRSGVLVDRGARLVVSPGALHQIHGPPEKPQRLDK